MQGHQTQIREDVELATPVDAQGLDEQLSPPDEVRISTQDPSIMQLPYIYETS